MKITNGKGAWASINPIGGEASRYLPSCKSATTPTPACRHELEATDACLLLVLSHTVCSGLNDPVAFNLTVIVQHCMRGCPNYK